MMSLSTNGDMVNTHTHVIKSSMNAYMSRVDVDSFILGQNEQQHEHDVPHSMHFNCFAQHENIFQKQLHIFVIIVSSLNSNWNC